MRLHTSCERGGLSGSPRGGGLALREAHLLLVLFGKRNGTWRNCQPGRWLRVRAMHDLRVQKSRDASGIFFVASAAEGAWVSRAHSLARAPLATRPRRKNPRDACKIVKSSFHSFHARAAAGAHENPAISARVLTEDAGVFFAAFFFAIVATWR